MNVEIIEIKTGKLAAAIAVAAPGRNWIPSEQAYFALAWQSAVNTKGMDPAQRACYSFHLVR